MNKGKHCVFQLDYHIVLVVKYRKKCLTKEIGDDIILKCKELVELNDGTLTEGNHDVDHIHLLVSLPPKICLSSFMGSLKNTTSRYVRKKYSSYLSKYLYGDSFWSDSYYVSTTGGASIETIKKYIENQGKPKRKYVKAQRT